MIDPSAPRWRRMTAMMSGSPLAAARGALSLIVRSGPVRPELDERRGKEGERNENESTIPRRAAAKCPELEIAVASRLRLAEDINVAHRDSMLLCIGPGARRRDRSQCAGALRVRAARGNRRC